MDGVTHLLAAEASADGWTQVAVLGKFKDPRYGEFSITPDMVASWQRNLSAVTGQPEIALDYDHSSDSGQRVTRASGWVRGFRIEGKKVLAKVDWTPKARESIEAGEYRYFSPTFVRRFLDDSGKDVGPTCIGGSLTNRPFLRNGMAPVTLDQYADAQLADTPAMSDFLTKLAQHFKVDASEDAILAALTDGEAVKTLAQGANLVVLPAEQVTTLTQQAEAGAAAAQTLHQMRFDNAFEKAQSEGRVTPALKDTYVALYAADADNALKLMAEAPVAVPMSARGDGEAGGAPGGATLKLVGPAADEFQVDAADTEVMDRAIALSQSEGIDVATALTKIAMEA